MAKTLDEKILEMQRRIAATRMSYPSDKPLVTEQPETIAPPEPQEPAPVVSDTASVPASIEPPPDPLFLKKIQELMNAARARPEYKTLDAIDRAPEALKTVLGDAIGLDIHPPPGNDKPAIVSAEDLAWGDAPRGSFPVRKSDRKTIADIPTESLDLPGKALKYGVNFAKAGAEGAAGIAKKIYWPDRISDHVTGKLELALMPELAALGVASDLKDKAGMAYDEYNKGGSAVDALSTAAKDFANPDKAANLWNYLIAGKHYAAGETPFVRLSEPVEDVGSRLAASPLGKLYSKIPQIFDKPPSGPRPVAPKPTVVAPPAPAELAEKTNQMLSELGLVAEPEPSPLPPEVKSETQQILPFVRSGRSPAPVRPQVPDNSSQRAAEMADLYERSRYPKRQLTEAESSAFGKIDPESSIPLDIRQEIAATKDRSGNSLIDGLRKALGLEEEMDLPGQVDAILKNVDLERGSSIAPDKIMRALAPVKTTTVQKANGIHAAPGLEVEKVPEQSLGGNELPTSRTAEGSKIIKANNKRVLKDIERREAEALERAKREIDMDLPNNRPGLIGLLTDLLSPYAERIKGDRVPLSDVTKAMGESEPGGVGPAIDPLTEWSLALSKLEGFLKPGETVQSVLDNSVLPKSKAMVSSLDAFDSKLDADIVKQRQMSGRLPAELTKVQKAKIDKAASGMDDGIPFSDRVPPEVLGPVSAAELAEASGGKRTTLSTAAKKMDLPKEKQKSVVEKILEKRKETVTPPPEVPPIAAELATKPPAVETVKAAPDKAVSDAALSQIVDMLDNGEVPDRAVLSVANLGDVMKVEGMLTKRGKSTFKKMVKAIQKESASAMRSKTGAVIGKTLRERIEDRASGRSPVFTGDLLDVTGSLFRDPSSKADESGNLQNASYNASLAGKKAADPFWKAMTDSLIDPASTGGKILARVKTLSPTIGNMVQRMTQAMGRDSFLRNASELPEYLTQAVGELAAMFRYDAGSKRFSPVTRREFLLNQNVTLTDGSGNKVTYGAGTNIAPLPPEMRKQIPQWAYDVSQRSHTGAEQAPMLSNFNNAVNKYAADRGISINEAIDNAMGFFKALEAGRDTTRPIMAQVYRDKARAHLGEMRAKKANDPNYNPANDAKILKNLRSKDMVIQNYVARTPPDGLSPDPKAGKFASAVSQADTSFTKKNIGASEYHNQPIDVDRTIQNVGNMISHVTKVKFQNDAAKGLRREMGRIVADIWTKSPSILNLKLNGKTPQTPAEVRLAAERLVGRGGGPVKIGNLELVPTRVGRETVLLPKEVSHELTTAIELESKASSQMKNLANLYASNMVASIGGGIKNALSGLYKAAKMPLRIGAEELGRTGSVGSAVSAGAKAAIDMFRIGREQYRGYKGMEHALSEANTDGWGMINNAVKFMRQAMVEATNDSVAQAAIRGAVLGYDGILVKTKAALMKDYGMTDAQASAVAAEAAQYVSDFHRKGGTVEPPPQHLKPAVAIMLWDVENRVADTLPLPNLAPVKALRAADKHLIFANWSHSAFLNLIRKHTTALSGKNPMGERLTAGADLAVTYALLGGVISQAIAAQNSGDEMPSMERTRQPVGTINLPGTKIGVHLGSIDESIGHMMPVAASVYNFLAGKNPTDKDSMPIEFSKFAAPGFPTELADILFGSSRDPMPNRLAKLVGNLIPGSRQSSELNNAVGALLRSELSQGTQNAASEIYRKIPFGPEVFGGAADWVDENTKSQRSLKNLKKRKAENVDPNALAIAFGKLVGLPLYPARKR